MSFRCPLGYGECEADGSCVYPYRCPRYGGRKGVRFLASDFGRWLIGAIIFLIWRAAEAAG